MDSKQLISAISELAATQNIDKVTVAQILRDILQGLIEKKFGDKAKFDVIIDARKGAIQIWRSRTIVADDDPSVNEPDKISLSEARKIEVDFGIGEDVVAEVNLLEVFTRRTVLKSLELTVQKMHFIQQERVYDRYKRLIGKVVTGEVEYIGPRHTTLCDDDHNRLILPNEEKNPGEKFRKRSSLRAIVINVTNKNNKVYITVSRRSADYLREILKQEIPEITDGIVSIRGIAREAGVFSKVIVESQDDRVDPSGACIGPGGGRIRTISKEDLNGEKIHIISYTSKLPILIKRIADISTPLTVETGDNCVMIYGTKDQMAQLYQNVALLTELLGCPVQIIPKHANSIKEPLYLNHLSNVIAPELLQKLKEAGLTTAEQVLSLGPNNLLAKTKLDDKTIQEIYHTLAKQTNQTDPLSNQEV